MWIWGTNLQTCKRGEEGRHHAYTYSALEENKIKSQFALNKKKKYLLVLLVEVVHVGDQVLHHVHVGEGVDLGRLVVGINLGEAGQGVYAS